MHYQRTTIVIISIIIVIFVIIVKDRYRLERNIIYIYYIHKLSVASQMHVSFAYLISYIIIVFTVGMFKYTLNIRPYVFVLLTQIRP